MKEEDIHMHHTEMAQESLGSVTAGKGGITIPSKPIADTLASLVCGGHQWVRTGREAEAPFMVFWTKHQKQYVCTKCGKLKWENED